MRKILIFLLFVLISLSFPKSSSALCYSKYVSQPGLPPSCGLLASECGKDTTNQGQCCDSISECNNTKPETFSQPAKSTTTNTENSALCNGLGVNTAIGCLMAGDPKAMISQLLGWGTIVGGGIAFLMIVLAGLQIVMAGGDPKKIQAAKELITSAISGLILIIFSVILLNVIGVKILGLNSLGFSL